MTLRRRPCKRVCSPLFSLPSNFLFANKEVFLSMPQLKKHHDCMPLWTIATLNTKLNF